MAPSLLISRCDPLFTVAQRIMAHTAAHAAWYCIHVFKTSIAYASQTHRAVGPWVMQKADVSVLRSECNVGRVSLCTMLAVPETQLKPGLEGLLAHAPSAQIARTAWRDAIPSVYAGQRFSAQACDSVRTCTNHPSACYRVLCGWTVVMQCHPCLPGHRQYKL